MSKFRDRCLANVLFQYTVAVRVTQLTEGFCLNLTDALTSDVESLTDFFQRFHAAIIKTISQPKYITLTRAQSA